MALHRQYYGNARREKKRKEKKRKYNENNFVFFSDEKNKIENLNVTEWGEIIEVLKPQSIQPIIQCR